MANAPEPHLRYRPDIDGLRAVAVLAVVWFHAFPNWGRGGFVGVDIFFVISGFLISSILFEGAARGTFSYFEFYNRRIRRIFPALIAVLVTSLGLASVIAFPKDTRLLGEHVVGGAAFASNFLLWSESGYFDWGSELKPLLHLWSLSVEEQYYIVWPIVVALLLRRGRAFVTVLIALLLASFCLNVALVRSHPTATFYLPATRIWELLIGSGLAYATRFSRGVPTSPAAVQALSSIGAVLVAAAIIVPTRDAAFPGWWALLPTLGAACLIAAGPGGWINRRALASRPAVFVGKISYPLYLWHWPLLVFAHLALGDLSRTTRLLAVAASFVLAWLTYRFLEKPIRFGHPGRRVPIALAATMVVVALGGAGLVASDGWATRFPPELRSIATAEFKSEPSRRGERRCVLEPREDERAFDPKCRSEAGARVPSVWLWGDSHADSLAPGFRAASDGGRRFALTQFSASACPPVLGFVIADRPHCKSINDFVAAQIAAARPDVVVLAGNWTLYDGSAGYERLDLRELQRTAAQLRAGGVRRVVVLGPLPRWLISQPTAILTQWRESGRLPTRSDRFMNRASFDLDAAVRAAAAAAGVDFFSPLADLCDASGCQLTVRRDGVTFPIAWDDAHLTPEAATVLVARWQRAILGDAIAAR